MLLHLLLPMIALLATPTNAILGCKGSCEEKSELYKCSGGPCLAEHYDSFMTLMENVQSIFRGKRFYYMDEIHPANTTQFVFKMKHENDEYEFDGFSEFANYLNKIITKHEFVDFFYSEHVITVGYWMTSNWIVTTKRGAFMGYTQGYISGGVINFYLNLLPQKIKSKCTMKKPSIEENKQCQKNRRDLEKTLKDINKYLTYERKNLNLNYTVNLEWETFHGTEVVGVDRAKFTSMGARQFFIAGNYGEEQNFPNRTTVAAFAVVCEHGGIQLKMGNFYLLKTFGNVEVTKIDLTFPTVLSNLYY